MPLDNQTVGENFRPCLPAGRILADLALRNVDSVKKRNAEEGFSMLLYESVLEASDRKGICAIMTVA